MTRTKQRWALYAFALSLIAALVTMVGVQSASAHTPSGGATCEGYFVKAVSYEARNVNVINSTFDGVKTERQFATNDQITGSWPQDGIAHTWSGFVHTNNTNATYSKNYGPITLTCGHLPKDATVSLTVTPPTCEADGSVAVTGLSNAVEVGQLDETPGTHSATFNAVLHHLFADGTSTKTLSYTIEPKDVTQHCFVQPPDERQSKSHSTNPSCVNQVVTTTFKERSRSYVWNGTAYVPGPWSAWTVTSVTATKVDLTKQCARHAWANVHKIDKCNCFADKVWLTHGPNVRVTSSHPTKLTWIFKVTGKTVNGHQYLLPKRINGSSGWANTQTYTFHTTNKVCPCHKTHTCHVMTEPHPPHCPVPGKLNGKPCHI